MWYEQDAINLINAHLPTPSSAPFIACGQPVFGVVSPPINVNHGENNTCNPSFSFYQVGSRTQWNVTKDFYLGVDVSYTHLNTSYQGLAVATPAIGSQTSKQIVDDQNVWSGIFRAQTDPEARNEGTSFVFGQR